MNKAAKGVLFPGAAVHDPVVAEYVRGRFPSLIQHEGAEERVPTEVAGCPCGWPGLSLRFPERPVGSPRSRRVH